MQFKRLTYLGVAGAVGLAVSAESGELAFHELWHHDDVHDVVGMQATPVAPIETPHGHQDPFEPMNFRVRPDAVSSMTLPVAPSMPTWAKR